MEQNLTADQVINMLSGIVETGKSFAENVSMDTLFSSNDEPKSNNGYYSDPMSRRNDVGGYSSAPYQPNARPVSAPNGNPYNYGYGYASDPVKYNSNQGYFSNSNPYAGNSRRFNDVRPGGYGSAAGYGNGSTSSSYGMGGASAPRPQQPQSNPYQSSPYDERNYRFPDDMGFGGSFNRGGYGW